MLAILIQKVGTADLSWALAEVVLSTSTERVKCLGENKSEASSRQNQEAMGQLVRA